MTLRHSLILLIMTSLLTACGPVHEIKRPVITQRADGMVEIAAPDCPDWSGTHVANYGNTTELNLGCANSSNLVTMVEDPRDLIRGNGNGSPDAERAASVIQQYRAGQSSGTSSEASATSSGGSEEGGS